MITKKIKRFPYIHKITLEFVVLELIFNCFLLYLIINEIKFWYEFAESKKFREEHMKPSYNMLTVLHGGIF
jgi:hypothetical protein